MSLGDFTFKPALVPSLITLAVLILLLLLGFWQLQRASQKRVLLERFATQFDLPYVPVDSIDSADPATRYRRVTAQGRYDKERQILLDNQIQAGQPGYHVFTPLRLSGKPQAILVNRGWLPLGVSRQQLPDIAVSDAEVTVRGRLSQPANPGLRLAEPAAGWPRVVQYLDYGRMAAELGYSLMPAVILLDPDLAGGYRRDWQPRFEGFGPEVHRGYAVQWFALAATLVVIYIVVNTRKRRVSVKQH